MSELEDDEEGLEPWQTVPSREAEPGENRDESIEALLCHLSGREAAVVRLRHLEQVETLAEIAEMLGISLSSVKTHYYRGLEKLRVVLEVGKAAGREDVVQ